MQRLIFRMTPLVALVTFAGLAAAQDPPSRVARLSYMSGSVSLEPAGVDQWTAASANYPLTTGDNLYTDNGARGVLRIGRNSIRLNSGTNFQIVNLSDQVAQMSINSGALSIRIRSLYEGETWEVDTPNGAVTLVRPGDYRVESDPERNATMVTVRSGSAEVTSNSQSFSVRSRETAYFDSQGEPEVRDANPEDEFDSFSVSRDRVEDVPPPQYVSQDLDGYEDLNANGSWRNTSDYGPVWTPRVASGWAPYHDGRWAWVEPWGWTWVDDAPWGFAPFHYGRWANIGGSWGWCPGPIGIRPVYAPALVAFVGGGGWGASLGFGGGGGVGWFPLGPREPYYPSYHVSDTYVRNVNISNTRITNVNVTNVNVTNYNYMNRQVPGAFTAVPQSAFASAQSVQRVAVRVPVDQLRGARVVGTAPQVVPQREAIVGPVRTAAVVRPPANFANRAVVARLAPPPARVPFQAQQQLLRQNPGRPIAPQQLQTLRQTAAPVRSVPVTAINPAQVRQIAPPVRSGAPGGFTPRANTPLQGQPGGVRPQAPGQVAPNVAPAGRVPQPAVPQRGLGNSPSPVNPGVRQQPAPPVRQQDAVPMRQQPAPQVRQQETAPMRQQAAPPVRQQEAAPMRQQPAPPVRQQEAAPMRQQPAPPVRQQEAAPMRQQPAPPVRQQEAAPMRQQPAPPVRQQEAAPMRQQPAPPVRQQEAPMRQQPAPQVRQQEAPMRQQPAPQVRQQAAPARQAERPAPARPEPKREDKKDK